MTSETERLTQAAQDRQLLYGYCADCQEAHHFPRSFCPFCFSDAVEWRQASGKGVIFSYSVMQKSETGPYVMAYVKLEEGPLILTNIIDSDQTLIAIDKDVQLVWKNPENSKQPVPFFSLV